jgi:thioredoxin-related protein
MKLFALVLTALTLADTPESFGAELPARDSSPWSRNLYGSFAKAVEAKKPLVVLFTWDDCDACGRLERNVIEPKALDQFAERGVFVYAELSDEDKHGNYARLREQLGVTEVPTLVVLDVAPDKLVEAGRVKGNFPAEKYVELVGQVLSDSPAAP